MRVDEKRAQAQAKTFTHNEETRFMDIYGRGGIMNEAVGPRRSLSVQGLGALDIRTLKPGTLPNVLTDAKLANW